MTVQAVQTSDVAQAVAAANRRFAESFSGGDPGREARTLYTRDARVMPPGGETVRGREAIVQFWPAAAQQLAVERVELNTEDLQVHGEYATEVGRATITSGGQRLPFKYVVLWKQEDGDWRIHLDIWNANS